MELILGTVGGIIFALGMCMCLIPEWDIFWISVFTTIIGLVTLLCIIPVYRKSHPKRIKEEKVVDLGLVLPWIVGVIGSLFMGFGMSRIMVGTPSNVDIVVGLITGIVGLLICVLNYPIYAYLRSNRK